MLKLLKLAALTAVVCCATGCASIISGGTKVVRINSVPPGAKVSVFDREDKPVSVQTTPASLTLKRGHAYFQGEKYKLVFETPGYYPSTTYIESQINGWYFGNMVFGGIVGILVDPATGAMFTLSPADLKWNMIPTTVTMSPEELKAAELKANVSQTPKSVHF